LNAAENNELHEVYLSLGSNISPEDNLRKAYDALKSHLLIKSVSTAWESPPFGGYGPNFINAIVVAMTAMEMNELKTRVIRPIEAQLGRIRGLDANAPRPIDLDIVIFADRVVDPNIWDHPYLTVPLAELIPEFQNPLSGESLADIAKKFKKVSYIVPRPEVQKLNRCLVSN
jgi:2-amino-4-hydroxy-6-hydroxymethyldihydropteridine diphosphokinase